VTVCDTCGTSDCPMHTPRVRRVTTQPDTDAPPTHTPGCSLSTAEASGHNRCGCWCHAGPPFRYMPDEVAAVLRPDLGRCHRETCEHGHVDHRPRNACRWCDCKAFVPSDAPQEGRPTACQVRPTGQEWREPCGRPMPCPAHSEGRPTTPQTEAGRTILDMLESDSARPFDRDVWATNIIDIEREAAAGALPSVEALAEALDAEMPVNLGPHEKFAAGVRRGMYRSLASRILARLASSEADRP
jgi:hypothetical protein